MNKIQELRAEAIKRHERLMAYLDAQEKVLGPVFEELSKLEPTALDVEPSYATCCLTGDRHKLNAAFGVLRRHGFEPGSRPEAKQSQYATFFTRKNDVGLYTEMFFQFSSTQCRRVKVGTRTKTVEEDVYETVCDEQEYPERAEQKEDEAQELPF